MTLYIFTNCISKSGNKGCGVSSMDTILLLSSGDPPHILYMYMYIVAMIRIFVIPDYDITVPGMLANVARLFCAVGCVSLGMRLSINSLLKECCNIVE